MFTNHPNKENIKFVVIPIIREFMMAKDDICSNIYDIIKRFTEEKCGINFDFSHVMALEMPQLWSIYDMGR